MTDFVDWNNRALDVRFSRGASRVPYVVDWRRNVLGLDDGTEPPAFLRKQVRGYVARAVTDWAGAEQPWAIIIGSTAWGREIASRVAARLGAGLCLQARSERALRGRLPGAALRPAA